MDPNTKRIVAIILAGAVAAAVVLGALIPEARVFLSDMVKGVGVVLGGLIQ